MLKKQRMQKNANIAKITEIIKKMQECRKC